MNNRKRARKKLAGYVFTPDQLWNLHIEFAKFCAAGIRQFIDMKRSGHPGNMTSEEWEAILKDIYFALRSVACNFDNSPIYQAMLKQVRSECDINGDHENLPSEKWYQIKVEYGLEMFGKYFMDLWD